MGSTTCLCTSHIMLLSHMDSKLMFSSSFCFFCLLTLPFCFQSASCAILSNETDRLALLAFKASITGDPLGAMSSWNNSIHFCRWSGVICGRRHQRVIVLDLRSQNLVGSISPYIGNLSFLTKVNLKNNSLSNEIPPEVGRLRRLRGLNLQNNSLVGEIPANLSSCHNLVNLVLEVNQLAGKIPAELGSLKNLEALVYEFMDNGSLEEWLHPSFVSDAEMTAQVGDFGLVKFLSKETNDTQIGHASSAGVRGTVGYAAPEYGMGSDVSTQGDVYSYGILLLEMFSGKRPTDNMFSDNMNLHNYVKKALPHHVEDITEPILLDRREEDEFNTSGERDQKIIESLFLIFGIGIACSEETPTERMNISDVLAKLLVIKDKLTDNGGRGRRAQVPKTRIPDV